MSAPLTNGQKAYLAQLAAKAFKAAGAAGDVGDWRRGEIAKACGKLGLRCCSQDDYGAVKAHFLHLLGEDGRALKADVRGQAEANARRQIEWKIVRRCEEYGIKIWKAEGICQQMTRGRGLQDADVKTLWNVFFKLRFYDPTRRAASLDRAGAAV